MNARERFLATFRFKELDRPFRWETPGFWPATIKKWTNEGLPDKHIMSALYHNEINNYFEMDKLVWLPIGAGWTNNPYMPLFEEELLSDDGHYVVKQDKFGITSRIFKENPDASMPQFLRFPVEKAEDFYEKIKWRLDSKNSGQFPADWRNLAKNYATRDYPLGLFVIGPFGYLRNLMGDEFMMYQFYDNPDFIHDMMKCWHDFYKVLIERVATDVIPDMIMIWEDMCYRSGPLVSPSIYRDFFYCDLKSVINTAKKCGVDCIIVDNDGDASSMLPIYLECGANAFYPFEVQAGMDIVKIRKEYGKLFTIIGGLDKRTLAENVEAVVSEIDKKVPFMLESGGYIPMTDHTIPPNVPIDMFRFFIDYLRRNYGEN